MSYYEGCFVHILPTTLCNLCCPYCYTNGEEVPHMLPREGYVERVCDFINRLTVSAIHLEGGEPLLYPELLSLINGLRQKDRIVLVTNGYQMTDPVLEQLTLAGVAKYIVSIDYARPDGLQFHKSCTQCLELFQARQIVPDINVTLSKENLGELEALFDLADQFQVNRIRLGDIVPIGCARTYSANILTPEDYEMLIPIFFTLSRQHESLLSSLSLHGKTFEACSADFQAKYRVCGNVRSCDMLGGKFTVDPNGDIYTCFNLIGLPKYHVGNIYQDSPLDLERYKSLKQESCTNCPVGIQYHISFKHGGTK